MGAVVGSLPGLILSVMAGYAGYKMTILGILIALGATWGYEKMGGSTDTRTGSIRCFVVLVIAVYLGEHLSWALLLHSALHENGIETTRFTCVEHLFKFLSILELTGEYIKSVLLSYLFALFGIVIVLAGTASKNSEKE